MNVGVGNFQTESLEDLEFNFKKFAESNFEEPFSE